ncbi:hypothetical protein SAMN02745174_02428 [Cetobacterium ceti]|uniref:Uncharacterized protein n=1 Tax=Cetobacterium ceti TaxID=180163 RepID=A0A1T4QS45_9FUSO|nr:hypothetical protein [Cetobacterium ceti]SKA06603.1 hypothetical protein SAMN02745174_02428 [Cetobacterium ceti]
MLSKNLKEEYIYKFRCSECKKLLGGITKEGYVVSFENTKHFTSIDGDTHIFICEKKNTSKIKCNTRNEINMIEARENLKNKNYTYID